MPITVVVLAAGQGKRMHSNLPKVLQPLAGRPMLAHVLDTARELNPDAIKVVYGHGGEQVRAAFDDPDLVWCLQAEQLGTGHAVMQAMPDVPDGHRVLILCGDVPLVGSGTLSALVDAESAGSLSLLTVRLDDPREYGRVLRNEAGDVVRIVEERDADSDERAVDEVNTGLIAADAKDLRGWLARLGSANAQGELYLTDVISMAFNERKSVRGIRVDDPNEVIGINDKRQLAVAERSYQLRQAESLMSRGVTLADPARIDVRGRLEVGRDVFIDANVVFAGDVTLGDGVSIGPGCSIANARLGADTVVHSHTVMDGIVTGAGCEIGPFARVRPGTELANSVKIGNFVEIKNSRVADKSKVNHLSYIGDTTIGTEVNVGAGTITCNYDGARKHRTTIGDRAFIGSGAMLVAPVVIGAGATIGAGSTISKDTPPEELTLARSRQVTISGWRRPVKPKS